MGTDSKEYKMAIKIAGNIDASFYNTMKTAQKQLNAMRPGFEAMQNVSTKALQAMAAASATAAAAVGGITAASINVGSEFESAFAGVRKTVNATEQEFSQMEEAIRNMSLSMPTTAAELSDIAAAAGQLGIQNENIAEFTETMANMAVATDLTSDEAATNFARFANITGMSQEYFDNLGSAVVALGNNMATTESEIVGMAMRLAGTGAQVNMTEAQIMGMAAALSSVGMEEEAGGSAFSKLMANMQLAVETGNKSLAQFAKVAGMSAQQFQEAFRNDAATAIAEFVTGLNNTERNGMSAIAVLDNMGITEVNMRRALLSAANANETFNESLRISEEAWESNTAMANEAAEKYKTFDSQVKMTKNNLSDMGISVFQSLRGTLTEGLSAVNTEAMEAMRDTFIDSGLIDDFAEGLEKKIPTLVRETKELGQTVGEFAEPFLAVGNWLADNPGLLAGTVASVGSALAAYKIANTVTSIAKALTPLGGIGKAIMGISAVAGVITGIGTAMKKSAEDAKEANLAEHFGDISLSLSDLDEAAEHIIYTDNLGKIREAMQQFDGLDTLQESISDSVSEINKMNWKISIGMELSEEESEDYRENIENYVQQCQRYIQDQQYAVTLAVGTLTEDDLEGQNLVNQLNEFYSDKQGELARLGTKLNKAITEAFNDGLLDIKEAEKISEIQAQMADIQAQLAGGNFEASLEVLSTKYGGNLTPESFQNLQAELAEKVQEAETAYEEAYQSAVSGQFAMLEDGEITKSEYDANISELREGYLNQLGEIQTRAAEFQIDTIMQQYEPEIQEAKEKAQSYINELLSDESIWVGGTEAGMATMQQKLSEQDFLDSDTRDAISELLGLMEETMNQIETTQEEYRSQGKGIPDELMNVINDEAVLQVLTGKDETFSSIKNGIDASWYQAVDKYVGKQIENNGDYEGLAGEFEQEPYTAGIAKAIQDNASIVYDATDELYQGVKGYTEEIFNAGFDVETPVNIKLKAVYDNTNLAQIPSVPEGYAAFAEYPVNLGGHKDGGIFDVPHIAWFAEDGPEAAIPLDGSRNAIELWEKTGQLLGLNPYTDDSNSIPSLLRKLDSIEVTADNSTNVEFKPELHFHGGTPDKADLEEAFDTSYDKFEAMLEKYFREKRRLSLN